jgi:hypothetical protein
MKRQLSNSYKHLPIHDDLVQSRNTRWICHHDSSAVVVDRCAWIYPLGGVARRDGARVQEKTSWSTLKA